MDWPAPDIGWPTKYKIAWRLNHRCNANCPYCSAAAMGRTGSRALWWNRKQALAAWERVHEDYGPVAVAFGGREASLRLPLIGRVLKVGHFGTLCTNLLRPPEDFAELIPDPSRLWLAASFHPLAWDGDAAEPIRRIQQLREIGFRLNLASVIAWPPFLDRLEEWRDQFAAADIKYTLNVFRGMHEGRRFPEGYTAEERAQFEHLLTDLQVTRQLEEETPGTLCLTGMYYLFVPLNGEVRRCLAVEGGVAPQNFYRDRIQFNTEPTPCTFERCRCVQVWPYHVKKQ